jgi:hypothetical protein
MRETASQGVAAMNGQFYIGYGNSRARSLKILSLTSMDILGCFLCLVLTIVLIALLVLSMRVVANTVSPPPRPLWPWSITTYNGWNQSIPQRPVAQAFFPRPWVL